MLDPTDVVADNSSENQTIRHEAVLLFWMEDVISPTWRTRDFGGAVEANGERVHVANDHGEQRDAHGLGEEWEA